VAKLEAETGVQLHRWMLEGISTPNGALKPPADRGLACCNVVAAVVKILVSDCAVNCGENDALIFQYNFNPAPNFVFC
jgi:hypothetical protein